jgi:hypothetical protein
MPLIGCRSTAKVTRSTLATALFLLAWPMALAAQTLTYPVTNKGDVVDTLHGVPVADPYRWLEALNSPETATWIARQNQVTDGTSPPCRSGPVQGDSPLWNYPRVTPPMPGKRRAVHRRNSGLQKQFVVLARRRRALRSSCSTSIVPRRLRRCLPPSRHNDRTGVRPVRKRNRLAGREDQEVRTGRIWRRRCAVRFSGLVTKDGQGFFSRYRVAMLTS